MGCSSSAEVKDPAKAPEKKPEAVAAAPAAAKGYQTSTKVYLKEGTFQEMLDKVNTTLLKEFLTYEGAVGFSLSKVDDTTVVGCTFFKDEASLKANAENIKKAMGSMAEFFAKPPERYLCDVSSSTYEITSENVVKLDMCTTTTVLTVKEGMVADALDYIKVVEEKVMKWDGFVGLVFSKVSDSDNKFVAYASYASKESQEANAENFKGIMGGMKDKLASPPDRSIGTVVFTTNTPDDAAAADDDSAALTTTKISLQEGKMQEVLDLVNSSFKKDFATWDGTIGFSITKIDENTGVGTAFYKNMAAVEANADNFKGAMGPMAAFFASPPERHICPVISSTYEIKEENLAKVDQCTTTTFITVKEGKMADAMDYIKVVEGKVKEWEGFGGLVTAKVADNKFVAYATYASKESQEANAENFKGIMGGMMEMMVPPPDRTIGTVMFSTLE